jgi:prepilin peptidase CpaA
MTAVHIVALTTALLASVSDIRARRIPNWLTFGSAGAALVFHGLTSGASGLAHGAGGWLVGLLVFLLPFALRGLGGGDVKLMAALGAWIGAADVLWLALYTGLAGGVLALGVALRHGYTIRAFRNIWLLVCHWRVAGLRAVPEISLRDSAAPKLAYAVPILAGTVAVIWLR